MFFSAQIVDCSERSLAMRGIGTVLVLPWDFRLAQSIKSLGVDWTEGGGGGGGGDGGERGNDNASSDEKYTWLL